MVFFISMKTNHIHSTTLTKKVGKHKNFPLHSAHGIHHYFCDMIIYRKLATVQFMYLIQTKLASSPGCHLRALFPHAGTRGVHEGTESVTYPRHRYECFFASLFSGPVYGTDSVTNISRHTTIRSSIV